MTFSGFLPMFVG